MISLSVLPGKREAIADHLHNPKIYHVTKPLFHHFNEEQCLTKRLTCYQECCVVVLWSLPLQKWIDHALCLVGDSLSIGVDNSCHTSATLLSKKKAKAVYFSSSTNKVYNKRQKRKLYYVPFCYKTWHTSILWKYSPIAVPMFLNVINKFLVFFCCPRSFLETIFVTTRWSTHFLVFLSFEVCVMKRGGK